MADPSESPKRQKSPAEEVDTSGGKTEAESGCSSNQKDEETHTDPTENPHTEQRTSVGRDCSASHPEVSIESGAGDGKKTSNPVEDLTSAEKMAEARVNDQRAYEWSETEDYDTEEKTHMDADEKKSDPKNVSESAGELQQDTHVEDHITNNATEAKTTPDEEKRLAEEPVEDFIKTEDVIEEDEEAEQEDSANLTAKPKKCRLECKECGQRFTRRETFNLHRHFHAHEDELTPLTCKECGLTFQHRSSLIKHKIEHKEKDEQLASPKKEEGKFKCAECEKVFSSVDKLRDHNCSIAAEKPYHCPLCRQEFQFKVSVTKHMMLHSCDSIFTCQECSQTFPDSMALRYHQRSHTALKPYECPECGLVFKHYSVMEDHRRKHTDNTRSHLCNICGKTFKYSSLLHQHQYLHTGQKPFRCPECGKTFAFAQNMKAHCRQHRLRQNNSSTEQPSNTASTQEAGRGPGKENTHQSEEQKRTFNCPLCPLTYLIPANLRAHMLIHEAEYETLERTPRHPKEKSKHWEKGYTCPYCPSTFREKVSLNFHILSGHKSIPHHIQKVTTLPQIQSTPLSSDNVQGKRSSDGEINKLFKCLECGKTFRHSSVLDLHIRVHSKDRPYKCRVCNKGFRFSSYLQQHLIIHTGEKPYTCPDCGKDFAFLQNMKTHQKLHQEKPFRCTSCRKGYSDETQLQHHMLSHNGDKPHKCNQCDKSFGLAYLLRDHMNTHTGERPHRCDECHKTFSWFSSLLVHQKIHSRKRQGLNQYNSFPMGARIRGRGGRGSSGRRGGRPLLGWSRPLGSSGPQLSPYSVSALRDAELHSRTVEPQQSMLPSHMDVQSRAQKDPWLPELRPQPVQWKVDGGEVMPVPQQQHAEPQQNQFDSPSKLGLQQHHHQRGPGWPDSPLITQSGTTSALSSESSHMKNSAPAIVSSHMAAVPKKSSPSTVSEIEQQRLPKPVTWSSPPTSTVLASTSSLQHDFCTPLSYVDGAALWSIRPALLANSRGSPNKLGQELQLPRWAGVPVSIQQEPSTHTKKEDTRVWELSNPQVIPSTVIHPEKPWNGSELPKQWVSGLPGVSTSAQIDQSSAMPISTPVSHGVGSTLWDLQTPPGIPKTINPEKLVNAQDFQKQVSSAWANVQSLTTTQKVPLTIQYEPHRFGQGLGTHVWGFQSNQTLLTGQSKPGNGPELQQQPMVTATQIIINQPSPFFSAPLAPLPPLALPGPHPLHSVAVGSLSRPPHPNIFFAPQAVMSERPHMPQTLPLPQLATRTETHKLGSRLPFAQERLLQCMICGCSLPRELDLQMHYMQHAQGDI
ncbi:hypothetical protein PBY51_017893 [Eleginops maclovinus]|uniref:C2H2-type domain-containing protein n=1 Tax=Eleginops maclovinus TaxID=56733 RepID=A0AAN7XFX2_ELEMC|nr:hypothetical protein PBY51_017893 [Eleginops maclovinus]